MEGNLAEISKISIVKEARRLELTDKVREILGPELSKKAEVCEKDIFVYKIIYQSKGKKVVGYIVEPRQGENLPCIIWNRGGSRDFGEIKLGRLFGGVSFMAQLAMQGYIVIATQYPGVAGGEGIDKMGSDEDLASILDLYTILKQYRRADSTRVGMYGHSRGGMMTYMCLSKVKWLSAAVIASAPSDEVNAGKFRKGWAEHQKKMYGGSLVEKKKRSAIYWANKLPKKVPILLVHGSADWRVNPSDSLRMAQKLYDFKIPYRFIFYEGADHGLTEFASDYQTQVFTWFNRFVKNKESLPVTKPHGD